MPREQPVAKGESHPREQIRRQREGDVDVIYRKTRTKEKNIYGNEVVR